MHRFRDIAFDMSNLATPLPFNPRRRGSLGRSPLNFARRSADGYGTKWRRNIAENFNRLSWDARTLQMTDRRICDRIPERNVVTFAEKQHKNMKLTTLAGNALHTFTTC